MERAGLSKPNLVLYPQPYKTSPFSDPSSQAGFYGAWCICSPSLLSSARRIRTGGRGGGGEKSGVWKKKHYFHLTGFRISLTSTSRSEFIPSFFHSTPYPYPCNIQHYRLFLCPSMVSRWLRHTLPSIIQHPSGILYNSLGTDESWRSYFPPSSIQFSLCCA